MTGQPLQVQAPELTVLHNTHLVLCRAGLCGPLSNLRALDGPGGDKFAGNWVCAGSGLAGELP